MLVHRPAYQVSISPETNLAYASLLAYIKELHAVVRKRLTDSLGYFN